MNDFYKVIGMHIFCKIPTNKSLVGALLAFVANQEKLVYINIAHYNLHLIVL